MLGDICVQYRKTVLAEYDLTGRVQYPTGQVVLLTPGLQDWEGLPSRVACCVPYLDEALEITGLLPAVTGEIRDPGGRLGDACGRMDRMLMEG